MSQHEKSITLNCFVNENFARKIVFRLFEIRPVNFKFSLEVLCCFFYTSDKKRKIANLFLNTSYEHKPSKWIERWKMDRLEREKNDKILLDNDIAQMVSEISGI